MKESVWEWVWDVILEFREMAEGLGSGVFLSSFRRAAEQGSWWGGAHLGGWPMKAAPVQRAGAVHVDLVHILQALPVHGDHLISCGGQMVSCGPFTSPTPRPPDHPDGPSLFSSSRILMPQVGGQPPSPPSDTFSTNCLFPSTSPLTPSFWHAELSQEQHT